MEWVMDSEKEREAEARKVEKELYPSANPADSRTQEVETTIEIALPQGRAENLIAQLNSAVNQAEQLQDQQVQQTVQRPVGRLRGAKV
jgi:hypothetical protein